MESPYKDSWPDICVCVCVHAYTYVYFVALQEDTWDISVCLRVSNDNRISNVFQKIAPGSSTESNGVLRSHK